MEWIAALAPSSIAVAGASGVPATLGEAVWRTLNDGTYRGKLHAVNRHFGELTGYVVYGRVQDLPTVPDLAVICVPAAEVPGLVEAFGKLGTPQAVVLSPGLTPAQQQAAASAGARHGMRVLEGGALETSAPDEAQPALAG